jgi:hypothetical protein
MAKFAGVDFIDFDSQLNDEEKLVRQTAREFVENEIIPIIEKHSREATFPMHLVPQLGELGFFGASLHGYGCAGMSSVAYGLMTQELERGDSGIRSFVSVQSALVMYPIYAFGSEEQKNKWLPQLQQGKKIGCFGLTEPQFGSNPGGMLTRAVKKAKKCGSLAVRWPMSPWSGLSAKTKKFVDSWWKRALPASKPGTCTASGRCALRSPVGFLLAIAKFLKKIFCPAWSD